MVWGYYTSPHLTVNHGHTALFGTYGMLSIALILIAYRRIVRPEFWDDRPLKLSFWALNMGFFLMAFGTLFPVGILQFSHHR